MSLWEPSAPRPDPGLQLRLHCVSAAPLRLQLEVVNDTPGDCFLLRELCTPPREGRDVLRCEPACAYEGVAVESTRWREDDLVCVPPGEAWTFEPFQPCYALAARAGTPVMIRYHAVHPVGGPDRADAARLLTSPPLRLTPQPPGRSVLDRLRRL